MERLILADGERVADADKEFCRNLQKALEAENANGGIVLPKDWCPGLNHRIGKLKVFDYYKQDYYAQRFAGLLSFQGRQVLIHSRFDKTGALTRYMMTKLGLMPRMLWNNTTEAETSSFRVPMVYTFLRQVKEACAIGIYRQYQAFAYNDSNPRGVINIPMHIRKNPINNGRIAYTTREYTENNPLNRLILATWQYIEHDAELGPVARKIVREHPELFAPVKALRDQLNSPYVEQSQLAQLIRDCSRPITHHMHTRYEQVRKTALTILKSLGFDQTGESSNHRVAGMLFPMDIMWEYFLEYAVFHGINFDSQQNIPILIPEGGNALRTIKPDFVLYNNGNEAVAVLDAKYKQIWGNAYSVLSSNQDIGNGDDNEDDDDEDDDSDNDRRVHNEKNPWKDSRIREDSFQVMSYMHVIGTKIGGILFPQVTAEESLPIRKISLYEGSDESILLIPVCLPEETEDFELYCNQMDTRCMLLRDLLVKTFSLQ